MIDYVAKANESNRFDPLEAQREFERRVTGGGMAIRHTLWRVTGIAAVLVVGIFIYSSWHNAWTEYAAYDVAQTFILSDATSVTLAPGATLRVQKHKDECMMHMTGKARFSVTESSEGLVLTKGMGAVLRSGAEIPEEITLGHPNPAAWAIGEFVYDNAPLDEVLSELSDYYNVTLTTQNPDSH